MGSKWESENTVDIWYISDEVACNFDCPYCITQMIRHPNKGKVWLEDKSVDRYRHIVKWIANLPFKVRIRMQTLGEPFVSKDFIAEAAWLTKQENIEFVELVTNGSFREKQFEPLLVNGDVSKLSLWFSYHPTQIKLDKYIANARYATSKGVSVVCNPVLFPDNLDEIENMIKTCKANGIKTFASLGKTSTDTFQDQREFPVLYSKDRSLAPFFHNPNVIGALQILASDLKGQPCYAGKRYFHITSNGDCYPCLSYASSPKEKLGNILDPNFELKLSPSFTTCKMNYCRCMEDFFHLKKFRESSEMGKSMVYSEAIEVDLVKES